MGQKTSVRASLLRPTVCHPCAVRVAAQFQRAALNHTAAQISGTKSVGIYLHLSEWCLHVQGTMGKALTCVSM